MRELISYREGPVQVGKSTVQSKSIVATERILYGNNGVEIVFRRKGIVGFRLTNHDIH